MADEKKVNSLVSWVDRPDRRVHTKKMERKHLDMHKIKNKQNYSMIKFIIK